MSVKSLSTFFLTGLALIMFAAVGCENPETGHGHGHDDHDHAHEGDGHDHGHAHHDHPAHGPFGGHIFPIDTEEYQAEWKKYGDNNVIRMYVLDAAGKKAASIAADSIKVTPKVGEGNSAFTLAPENPENGLASVYVLDDAELAMAIPLGVDIEIKVGDKMIKGEIKAHEPLDH